MRKRLSFPRSRCSLRGAKAAPAAGQPNSGAKCATPTPRATLSLFLALLLAFAPLARADILIPPGGAITAGSTTTSGFPTGSLFYNDASNKLQPLGQGTTGQALLSNGAGAAPSFGNVAGSGTVTSCSQYSVGVYLATGTTISCSTYLTLNGATLEVGANGAPGGILLWGNLAGQSSTILPSTYAGQQSFTLPYGASDRLIGANTADTLANKAIDGGSNTITNVSLATGVTGNLPVSRLNGGTAASSSTFWRGDGSWGAPSVALASNSTPTSADANKIYFSDGTKLQAAAIGANLTLSGTSPNFTLSAASGGGGTIAKGSLYGLATSLDGLVTVQQTAAGNPATVSSCTGISAGMSLAGPVSTGNVAAYAAGTTISSCSAGSLTASAAQGWAVTANLYLIAYNEGIDIAAGQAADSGGAVYISINSAMCKNLTGAWAAGGAPGSCAAGMGNGLTVAASTWYFLCAIRDSAGTPVNDVFIDTSPSCSNAPTSLTAPVYTRAIGAIKTNSASKITPYVQIEDKFVWNTPVFDVSALTMSPISQLVSLPSVPPNVTTRPILMGTSLTAATTISDGNTAGPAGSGANCSSQSCAVFFTGNNIRAVDVYTDGASPTAHVRAVGATTSASLSMQVHGFIWSRGRM